MEAIRKVPYRFPDPNEKHLTTLEAAQRLGVDADTVKKYCNSKPPRLRAMKVGRTWAIPLAEVKRYLKESSVNGRPKKAHCS